MHRLMQPALLLENGLNTNEFPHPILNYGILII